MEGGWGGGDVFLKSGAEGFWKKGDYSDPLPSHLSPWQPADRQPGRWGALLPSDPLFYAAVY